MAIGFSKRTWVNGGAPALSATNLQAMDDGIQATADSVDALKLGTTVGTETTLDDTDNIVVQDAEDSYKIKLTTVAELWAALWTKLGALIAGGTDKATPLDADTLPLSSAADSNASRKLTWANVKSVLATAFKHGGSNEIATATPAANVIPKADASGDLDAFVTKASAAEMEAGTEAVKVLTPATVRNVTTKRTKMPDGATAVYSQDAWATADGWSAADGTVNHTDYPGFLTIVSTGVINARAIKDFSAYIGKTVLFRVEKVSGNPVNLAVAWAGSYYTYAWGGASAMVIAFRMPLNITSGTFAIIPNYNVTDAAGVKYKLDWIWIGDYSYLTGSLSEEAARIADQLGDSTGVGVAASGTITSNGTAPGDGDTVTIAGKAYTYKTVLGTTEGQVLIGASAAEALDNLKAAVNSTGVSAVQYCAAAHPLVEATTNTDTVQTLAARSTGELGNSITLAKSAATLTLSGTTLSGGYSDAAAKIITAIGNNIAGGGTRPAAAKVDITTSALIGYESTVDVASGATFTLPAGGTWVWNVYGYGATISSAKRGSSAGGTTLTVAGANASVGYRRYA